MYEHGKKAEPSAKTETKVASKAAASPNPTRQPAWTNALGSQPVPALQPKLTVNQPGDEYEQEADRVASQVMRMASPAVTQVQRCACGGIAGPDGECAACKAKRLGLQRQTAKPEEEVAKPSLQRKNTVTSSSDQYEEETDQAAKQVAHQISQPAPQPNVPQTPAQEEEQPLAVQRKLTVNQPGDEYEQEADRVAAQVMRMASPAVMQVQRCACGGIAGPDGECSTCKAKRLGLQRKANGIAHTEAPPSVHQTLHSSGQPLDAATRSFMEPRFGQDFSNVRVHTDSQAAQSAADVNAHAYTVGNNLVFGAGQYAPESNAGRQLLAHELTHTVQQRNANTSLQRDGSVTVTPVEIDPRLQWWLDYYNKFAKLWRQDGQYELAARARRTYIILQIASDFFTDETDLESFINDAAETAANESDTLAWIDEQGGSTTESVTRAFPDGFPIVWSANVGVLYIGLDEEETLKTEVADKKKDLDDLLLKVPVGVLDKGLPLSFNKALALTDYHLYLADALNAPTDHIANQYARTFRTYLAAFWPYSFFVIWNGIVDNIKEAVVEGKQVVDVDAFDELVKLKEKNFENLVERVKQINSHEDIVKLDGNILDLRKAAFIAGFASTLASMVFAAAAWLKAAQNFEKELAKSDKVIAAEGDTDKIARSLSWAYENDYFGESAAELVQALLEEGWKIAAITAGFIVVQFIPFLNVAVDYAMLAYSGYDATKALAELKEVIDQVTKAKTVVDLQKATARFAQALLGDGLRVFMDLLAIRGSIKGIKARAASKLASEASLSEREAVKQALREAKESSNKGKSGSGAKEPPPREEIPKEPTKPGEEPVTPKEEPTPTELTGERPSHPELEPYCMLGSLICPKGIPPRVRKRVGTYPHASRVPYPKGGLSLRGTTDAVYQALRKFTGKSLRKIYLEHPEVWSDEFKAVFEARKAKWPNEDADVWWPREGGGKNTGKRWQPHHKKPLDFGGDNSPENLVALEPSIHVDFTNWWNALKREIAKDFTNNEWDKVIGGEKNKVYMPEDFE